MSCTTVTPITYIPSFHPYPKIYFSPLHPKSTNNAESPSITIVVTNQSQRTTATVTETSKISMAPPIKSIIGFPSLSSPLSELSLPGWLHDRIFYAQALHFLLHRICTSLFTFYGFLLSLALF